MTRGTCRHFGKWARGWNQCSLACPHRGRFRGNSEKPTRINQRRIDKETPIVHHVPKVGLRDQRPLIPIAKKFFGDAPKAISTHDGVADGVVDAVVVETVAAGEFADALDGFAGVAPPAVETKNELTARMPAATRRARRSKLWAPRVGVKSRERMRSTTLRMTPAAHQNHASHTRSSARVMPRAW